MPLLSPKSCGLFILAALAFLPSSGHRVERDPAPDLEQVKNARCEYRGISASFEQVTRAYVLQVYERPQLLRWEARLGPRDPDRETLITAIFTAAGLKSAGPEATSDLAAARHQALPSFGVIWCLNTLPVNRITPGNIHARDALQVYQQTVEHLLAQMVILSQPAVLRHGPGAHYQPVETFGSGTVFLEEEKQDSWSYVRLPSSATAGWIEKDKLHDLQ